MNMESRTNGRRHALVTGGGTGIGAAVAQRLAADGMHVTVLGRRREKLAAMVAADPARFHAVAADVSDTDQVAAALADATRRFGVVQVLVNNAGAAESAPFLKMDASLWRRMLDVNLKGAWLVARRTIPVMINQHSGVIINNSSVAGVRGMNRLSHYVASKWGLLGLTKSWAIELAPYGIRVVAICPTGVDTGMIDGLAGLAGTTPAEVAEHTPNLLPISLIDPEDVAEAVLFLAGRQARTITGSTLVLDAGMLTK